MTAYGYMIGLTTGAQNGTGTVSIGGGGVDTTLVGVGTAFTTELALGSIILCAGHTWSVTAISDNENLTIAIPASDPVAAAAFTYINLVNVETLNVTDTRNYAPKSTFRPYAEAVQLANGRARGFGRALATWRWGYIPLHFRTALRTYCPIKSYDVYIRTRTNEADAYAVYSAVVLWPDDEDKDAGRRIRFTLEFRNLVTV